MTPLSSPLPHSVLSLARKKKKGTTIDNSPQLGLQESLSSGQGLPAARTLMLNLSLQAMTCNNICGLTFIYIASFKSHNSVIGYYYLLPFYR